METGKDCKGCSASVRHSFEEVKSTMAEYMETIEPDLCVAEDLYNERLAGCSSCPGLYYETTCRYCGCFVQLRALRKNTECPHPAGSRWRSTANELQRI